MKDIINIINDYVVSYIIRPGVKVYLVNVFDDKLFCTDSILSARQFECRDSALAMCEKVNRLFDIQMDVELYKIKEV